MSGIPVTPQAYGEIVDALDEIVDHMKREYSKSEEEVQAWLEDFILMRDAAFEIERLRNRKE